MGRCPGIHHTAPAERDEKGGERGHEQEGSERVDSGEFRVQVGGGKWSMTQEHWNEDKGEAAEGEVKPEDPSLKIFSGGSRAGGNLGLTQERFWANDPPMMGPVTDPNAQVAVIRPNHFPRSRRETRSVAIT